MTGLRALFPTLLLAAACATPSPQPSQRDPADGAGDVPKRLVIVGINDVHGALLAAAAPRSLSAWTSDPVGGAEWLGDGQSVAVKERSVLAVEAIEGTDQAIARAGQLCRAGGFTVVKVAKPQQDMRFDVPTIGCNTVESLHRAGGRVLAIEAGKTIVVDQEETVALANRYGLTVVALSEGQTF